MYTATYSINILYMKMIIVKKVSKSINDKGRKKDLIKNLSFSIPEGEIVGYIGPNGAGKSTTIKMLCGVIEPSKGEIEVCGITPYNNRIQNGKNIGVVFGQRTQLWWDLPLRDSYDILARIYGIEKNCYKRRVDSLSTIFDIKHLFNASVRTLSLGERMKADIVASLLHNPKVLFLDEPTIGLDFISKRRMREAILSINYEYRTTIVLTTHDFDDIEELCSRIIVINQGTLIYDGFMNDLNRRFRNGRILELPENDKIIADLKRLRVNYKSKNGKCEVMLTGDLGHINETIMAILNRHPSVAVALRETPLEATIERMLLE